MGSAEPEYELKVFTPQELQEHACLPGLWRMINRAFANHHRALIPPTLGHARYDAPQDVIRELGRHGICCVLLEITDGASKPIATAAIKPYKEVLLVEGDPNAPALIPNGDIPSEGDKSHASWMSIQDWELSSVAVDQDAKYAKQGLASRCCAEVERYLADQFRAASKSPEKTGQVPGKLTIWIRGIKENVGAYWARRGYQDVSIRVVGKGGWGATRSFELVSSKKELVL